MIVAFETAPIRRWVLLCGAAEAVGMSAAAAAARLSSATVGEPSNRGEVAVALALVVAGGLIEGTALGLAQAMGLRTWRPRLRTAGYVAATVVVAGLGWAAVSAPAALAGSGDAGGSPGPAPWLVVAGGAALGGAMGALLGAAQAATLRHQLRHPWRWVGANALAWVPAMVVIFLGATAPGYDWPTPTVIGTGTLTGAVAGALLGAMLGWALPSLEGAPIHNRVILAVLGGSPGATRRTPRGTRRRPLGGALIGLRVRGVVTGRWMELPVMYAADPAGLVVVPGRADRKRWWRNLRTPAPVGVLREGHWQPGEAVALSSTDTGYGDAVVTYRRRWPRVKLPPGCPVIRIRV